MSIKFKNPFENISPEPMENLPRARAIKKGDMTSPNKIADEISKNDPTEGKDPASGSLLVSNEKILKATDAIGPIKKPKKIFGLPADGVINKSTDAERIRIMLNEKSETKEDKYISDHGSSRKTDPIDTDKEKGESDIDKS